MALRTPPSWLQNAAHPAENDRLTTQALWATTGIIGTSSLAVSPNSPTGMSVVVASGWAAIIGTTTTNMGAYVTYNDANQVLTITTADPSLPRVDRIVITVRDSAYSGANNDVIFQVLAGTPAASPSAPATPANSISLATVAVAASATTITAGNITDTRVSTTINVPIGDITEVQGGTGISVASGTGPVPVITSTVATAYDAKGDLIVGTGADAFVKLPSSGTNDQILTVDTATASGLKWAAPADQIPLTTKGDLLTFSTTDTRLAVGTNQGDNLVVDSTTTTGLRWSTDWNTGKNKIINSDFVVNQRQSTWQLSLSTPTNEYNFDRWTYTATEGNHTLSSQSFTLGSAPATPYEGSTFFRVVVPTQTLASSSAYQEQRIESVRTLANQTITISFWAKAATGTPKIAVEVEQNFGTGGTPSAVVQTYAGQATISTSWARYSVTVANPSISGKTLGTAGNDNLTIRLWVSAGSNFNARTGSLGLQSGTFDLWGVQVESGSVATAFTTASGSFAGELALCQRYYLRITNLSANAVIGVGTNVSTSSARIVVPFPVQMRTAPTNVQVTVTPGDYQFREVASTNTLTAGPTFTSATRNSGVWSGTTAGVLTTGRTAFGEAANTSAYIGWSAEL